MIPRHQRILFAMLLTACIVMAVSLLRLRERAQQRLLANPDAAPLFSPSQGADDAVTLVMASDVDGTLTPIHQDLPLPKQMGSQARTLLSRLLAEYAQPDSKHKVGSGVSVDDVFLLPLSGSRSPKEGQPLLAVVNLDRSFVERHPSGIETEMLTIFSITHTLHANLPQIAAVHFLVGGQTRGTLAGHADLTRTYPAADDVAETQP